MNLIEAIVLAIVQGITEFLPISSSAHLALVPWWLGWDDASLFFEVVVHLGTTLALISYFWADWRELIKAGLQILRQRKIVTAQERLLLWIAIATIPGVIGGFLIEPYFDGTLSEPAQVAAQLYLTAALLIFSEWYTARTYAAGTGRNLDSMKLTDSIAIGVAQAVAIIPGISRSGSTIATGLALGFNREAAARFSFVMATPIILGAGAKKLLDVVTGSESVANSEIFPLVIAFIVSAVVGYLSIAFLLQYVRQHKLYGFAYYVIAFATITLIAVVIRG
ncbi:MAG: undecaprenyl-diphosphatase UppP [Anaerolineae bacterium]|nr:undecaprenyl-diphosphatase UppP [Anaerolineae bacterium]